MKDIVSRHAEQPEVEHGCRIMLIDVIGEIVIDRLVEAVILNIPASMSHFNNRPCVSTLW